MKKQSSTIYLICSFFFLFVSCSSDDDSQQNEITGTWEARQLGIFLEDGKITTVPLELTSQCYHTMEFSDTGNYVRQNYSGNECTTLEKPILGSYSINGTNLSIDGKFNYKILNLDESSMMIDFADKSIIKYEKID